MLYFPYDESMKIKDSQYLTATHDITLLITLRR